MNVTSDRSGAILITSLWILAILSILAIGIGFRVSIEARLSKYNMDGLKALYIAKAGIVRCLEVLSNDTNSYDSIYECGATLSDEENVKGHPAMTDEERKININNASDEVLKRLFSDDIAASIACWRAPAPGSDDYYYESLIPPYQCKHGSFCAIEELLLVKGMTLEIFNFVKDNITVYGPDDGRNNINTAPKAVLVAIGMPDILADKVIRFRNGHDGEPGTNDDGIFLDVNSIDSVLQLNLPDGITDEEILVLGNLKNKQCFTTVSNYFRIESKGAIDGLTMLTADPGQSGKVDTSKILKRIVCVAQRDTVNKGAAKLISYREY